MKIEFSEHARQQLDLVYDFICKKSETAAAKVYNDVLDNIERLADFPEMAPVEPLLDEEVDTFRSLVVRRAYKVIYFISGETIYVIDIWDCRQDPAQIKRGVDKKKK